jgi:zinc transporter ZupT
MDTSTFKWLATALLLIIGLVGGFLPLWTKKVSQFGVHVAYAFSGGILAALAMVHMLDDASGDLQDLGVDFAKALSSGTKDDFPMGSALFLVGFFFISSIEAVLHHTLRPHGHDHSTIELAPGEAQATDQQQGETRENELLQHHGRNTGNAAGWASLAGLTIHSFFEGVAMGVPTDQSVVGALVVAVAAHKGFAAFAVSSVNLPLMSRGKQTLWILVVLWFALTGPVGMMIGMTLSDSLDSVGVAVVTALAAGSVLSVAVNEMLVPAFKSGQGLGWKILSAWIGLVAMSLLGVWC